MNLEFLEIASAFLKPCNDENSRIPKPCIIPRTGDLITNKSRIPYKNPRVKLGDDREFRIPSFGFFKPRNDKLRNSRIPSPLNSTHRP
ncbi:MAG: hypothetical protein MSC50_05770 [Campylobacter sp.]|uniref:hypothetical protein n=1 Tax=Campylobacter sp. TaxID=205 RepID=UPI002AA74439|nr:hypothetical protein [Campylobacter sp.]MCI6579763.1 hypothetical protein [Campylobacter sp.]